MRGCSQGSFLGMVTKGSRPLGDPLGTMGNPRIPCLARALDSYGPPKVFNLKKRYKGQLTRFPPSGHWYPTWDNPHDTLSGPSGSPVEPIVIRQADPGLSMGSTIN